MTRPTTVAGDPASCDLCPRPTFEIRVDYARGSR